LGNLPRPTGSLAATRLPAPSRGISGWWASARGSTGATSGAPTTIRCRHV